MQEQADFTPSIPATPEAEPFRWNPAVASKFLFLSFRHSQGSPEIQQWLFEYTRSAYGQLPLYEQWEAPIKRRLSQAIAGYLQFGKQGDSKVAYHKPVSPDLLTFEVYRAYESMQQALSRPTLLFAHERIVYMISVDVLKKESEYLLAGQGRPRDSDHAAVAAFQNQAFFSYLEHYALNHHPTGLVVFDRLYAEIDDLIEMSRQAYAADEEARPLAWRWSGADLDELEALYGAARSNPE